MYNVGTPDFLAMFSDMMTSLNCTFQCLFLSDKFSGYHNYLKTAGIK